MVVSAEQYLEDNHTLNVAGCIVLWGMVVSAGRTSKMSVCEAPGKPPPTSTRLMRWPRLRATANSARQSASARAYTPHSPAPLPTWNDTPTTYHHTPYVTRHTGTRVNLGLYSPCRRYVDALSQ